MAACDLPLKESAKRLVFGQGNPNARIVFVGQAPGLKEDESGEPFIGSAGKILDALFLSAGLSRADVYITSILKYFPPRNRVPNFAEIKAHTPFLVDQINIIAPEIIAPMGNFAARFILGGFDIGKMVAVAPITALHGKKHYVEFKKHVFTVMPLYHPAAGLYFPPLKKEMVQDFRFFKNL
jgi:uracil-DNA glycosylase